MNTFDNYFVSLLKNKYADFEGRARRSEYWYFALYYVLIVLAIYAIIGLGYLTSNGLITMIGSGLIFILALGIIIPSLAVSVRRLHDTGKSGWWYLIAFIPLIGSILLIVFFCTDSQPGPNQYGPNPKELDQDDLVGSLIE